MRNFFKRNKTDNSQNQVEFDEDFYDNFWIGFRDYLEQEESTLSPFSNPRTGKSYDLSNDYTYFGLKFG